MVAVENLQNVVYLIARYDHYKVLRGMIIDWNNVKILDSENNLRKRLYSEMIYIKKQGNEALNVQKNTEEYDSVYDPLLKYIRW